MEGSWAVDPALILLGGGMINSRQVWWRALEQRLAGLGTPLTIRPATLDNDAGMFGAARLAFDRAAITVNTGE